VSSLHCDDSHVYCGQENQVVAVHSAATGIWVRDLPCGQAATAIHRLPTATGLLVAGAKGLVAAAVIADRVTAVWSKAGTMEQLHQGCHAGSGLMKAIAASEGKVVSQAEDGTIVVLEKGELNWSVTNIFKTPPVFHNKVMVLDCAGEWVAAFLASGEAMLWQAREEPISIGEATIDKGVTGVLLPPCVILVQGNDLKVVELKTRKTIRQVSLTSVGDSLIVASSEVHVGIWSTGNSIGFELFEKKELLNTNIQTNQLWRRKIELPRGCRDDSHRVALNTTSLIVVQQRVLSVQDFWLQREKGEEELAREREAAERERRRREVRERDEELTRSRPSYVGRGGGGRKKGGGRRDR
jgi:hypothetical protein